MATYRYSIVLTPAEEGGYVVTVPALPGCVTEGDTLEEALAMAQDAIKGYVESLHKHHEPIPIESEAPKIQVITVDVAA